MSRTVTRPRILTRAARAGAALYRRDRDLSRIMPKLVQRKGKDAVVGAIAAAEAHCESERVQGAATYSLSRHINLLSALIAEAKGSAQTA